MNRSSAKPRIFATPVLAALLLCLDASMAQAELVCTAQIDALVLGQVSVRDGFANPTFGQALLSCSGGGAGATVQACLRFGSGGGGAVMSPRKMRGLDGATLDYQLTAQSSFSAGGRPLDTLSLPILMDETGTGATAPTLFAEITSLGAQAKVGNYNSRFAAGIDVDFTYGEGNCSRSGDVNSFDVSADLTASCSVDVTSMDFGTVTSALTLDLFSSAQISVSCTNAVAYTVGLDFGNNASDSSASGRRMANGPNTLRYGLFQDAGNTSAWGLIAGVVHDAIGTGSTQMIDIFGQVFSDQRAAPGRYADSVVVVITY